MNIELLKNDDIYLKAFKYIIDKSTSNTLPYHNISHILDVFNFTYELCDYYKIEEIYSKEYVDILCISALFHDFSHSGGELSDSDNIKIAIKGSNDFIDEYFKTVDFKIDIDKYKERVNMLISSTEFPHKDMCEYDIEEIFIKIIRDSDLLSIRKNNSLFTTIFCLSKEFGISVGKQLSNQKKFLLNIKNDLYLDYSKDVSKKVVSRNISEVMYLDKIVNKTDNYSYEDSNNDDRKLTPSEHLERLVGKEEN